jgi:hypothetical protein
MASTMKTVTELRERARGSACSDLDDAEFRARFTALVGPASSEIGGFDCWYLPASMPPWFDTGIDLEPGAQVTAFAAGRTYLSRELDMWLRPSFQLWYRVGELGEIFRGARCSHTFSAGAGGRLYLAGYFPGEWATTTGVLAVPPDVYAGIEGGISVAVVRWAADALSGLEHIVRRGDVDGLVASEIARLKDPVAAPATWRYMASAPLETYADVRDAAGRPAIACYVREDAAILRKDVSLPFLPGTRLRWSWKIDVLPSAAREDELQTHDYLSIAVEFDDGQDLTFFWSAELPYEAGFRCPIPTWTARETHVVVRSGSAELGRWLDEERDLYADYERYVGKPPARIVRVWLIAVSLFRRHEGQGEFAAIEIVQGDHATAVLPRR